MRTLNSILLTIAILASSMPSSAVFAQEDTDFTDLPSDHFAYEAVMYLKEQGVISGYEEDNTFRPNNAVTRAAAIKMIVAPLITDDQLTQAQEADSSYADIPNDAWYKPYVELARLAGIVDGPPEKTEFNGANTVIKVEFMKMVQEAFGADPKTAFSEINLALADDVENTNEWFYPYMRYGITSSMTMISNEGTLMPGKQLTRAETAVLLYRYIMYQQGRRTQALLSEAENEILLVLTFLEQNDIVQSEYASARALLAARGAHAAKPDEGIVQGAVKITEAFRALVRAYRAGTSQDYEETVRLAGEAWNLSTRARELDGSLTAITEQVQNIAKSMADSARANIEEGS